MKPARHRIAAGIIAVLLAGLPATPDSAERYEVREGLFLFLRLPALYSIPGGPATEAVGAGRPWAVDRNGNAFGVQAIRQRVVVITGEGRLYPIAGTGVPGYRDGRAPEAMFAFGGRGYPYAAIGVDSLGTVFVADGYNHRIRKIFRQPDGTWQVTTLAGGGSQRLAPGQRAEQATAVRLEWTPVTLAVDAFDNVWFEAGHIFRVTPSGEITSYSASNDRSLAHVNMIAMAADRLGHVYGLSRENWASQIWMIAQDGRVRWLAGLTDAEITSRRRTGERILVDGPAGEATIWSASTLVVEPSGAAIYFGGGDETSLRRYKDGRVASLTPQGVWAELQNRTGGLSVVSVLWVDEAGRIYTAKLDYHFPDRDQWSAIRVLVPVGQ